MDHELFLLEGFLYVLKMIGRNITIILNFQKDLISQNLYPFQSNLQQNCYRITASILS